MGIVYLVRHGAYSNPEGIMAGRLPLKLSDEGVRQAERLRDYFKDKEILRIYSSPVMRCKQTSEIISDKKITIEFDLRLAETFTAYQGWKSVDPADYFAYRHELGGESYDDLKNRMFDFFNEKVRKEKGNVVICSHSDPLWCLYLAVLNRPLTDEITEPGENGNPEYLRKGAVMPLKEENGSYKPLGLLLQEDLQNTH